VSASTVTLPQGVFSHYLGEVHNFPLDLAAGEAPVALTAPVSMLIASF